MEEDQNKEERDGQKTIALVHVTNSGLSSRVVTEQENPSYMRELRELSDIQRE